MSKARIAPKADASAIPPLARGESTRATPPEVQNASMPIVAVVAAIVAALIHVWFFVLESVQFEQPRVYRRFGLKSPEDAAIVRPMAFNQGFYNLFLAVGIAVGLGLVAGGQVGEGRAIVLSACAVMLAAAVVLFASNRRFLVGAAIQGGPPLVALVSSLLL